MGYERAAGGKIVGDVSSGGGMLSGAVAQLDRELATFGLVQERLVEAWGYLMRMPDRERGWQRIGAVWPDISRTRRDYEGWDPKLDRDVAPRKPGLRTVEVDRMEEALGWIGAVKERDRKLLGVVLGQLQRADEPEWHFVAVDCGREVSADAYRKRYGRAITGICERLNAAEIRR